MSFFASRPYSGKASCNERPSIREAPVESESSTNHGGLDLIDIALACIFRCNGLTERTLAEPEEAVFVPKATESSRAAAAD